MHSLILPLIEVRRKFRNKTIVYHLFNIGITEWVIGFYSEKKYYACHVEHIIQYHTKTYISSTTWQLFLEKQYFTIVRF